MWQEHSDATKAECEELRVDSGIEVCYHLTTALLLLYYYFTTVLLYFATTLLLLYYYFTMKMCT